MAPLVLTVFLASLLGSLHCAGMCGAFVAFAVGLDSTAPTTPRWKLHAAYNGGRLITYVALGSLAGLLGSMVDLGGSVIGIQRVAGALAAAVVATFGVYSILRVAGVRLPKARPPAAIEVVLRIGHRRAAGLTPIARAMVIGLLTTLLPCGWLYAFVATAAGTASPLVGGVVMAVFWIGTLPILITLGASVRTLSGRFGKVLPVAMPILVTLVAIASIFFRSAMPARLQTTPLAQSASLGQSAEHIRTINNPNFICSPSPAEPQTKE